MRSMTSKTSFLSRVVSVAVLGCSIPVLAAAQVPRNRPLLPGEQWVRLFNGKDLTNWVEVGKEKWTVEDGTIHGQGVTNAYGYLQDREKVQGFLVLAPVQVRSRRQQRRLLPHRIRARHGRRQPGHAVRDRSDASTTTTAACTATADTGSRGPRPNTNR